MLLISLLLLLIVVKITVPFQGPNAKLFQTILTIALWVVLILLLLGNNTLILGKSPLIRIS